MYTIDINTLLRYLIIKSSKIIGHESLVFVFFIVAVSTQNEK